MKATEHPFVEEFIAGDSCAVVPGIPPTTAQAPIKKGVWALFDEEQKMRVPAIQQEYRDRAEAQARAVAAMMSTCPSVQYGGNRAGKTKSLSDDVSYDVYSRFMDRRTAEERRRHDVNQALHEPVRHRDSSNLLEALRIRVLEHSVYLEDRTGETPEYVRRLQAENATLKKALSSVQRQHDNLRSELDSFANDVAEMRSHLGL